MYRWSEAIKLSPISQLRFTWQETLYLLGANPGTAKNSILFAFPKIHPHRIEITYAFCWLKHNLDLLYEEDRWEIFFKRAVTALKLFTVRIIIREQALSDLFLLFFYGETLF